MASWAGMLATPATAEPVQPDSTLKGKNVAVVDANAIINMGYAVRSLGDMLFTTEDILKEIRDGKSRQVVDQVEFTCRNPSDESIKAGERPLPFQRYFGRSSCQKLAACVEPSSQNDYTI